LASRTSTGKKSHEQKASESPRDLGFEAQRAAFGVSIAAQCRLLIVDDEVAQVKSSCC
jgi:ABC-type antimicrobial peptide transport system ATPase subunit